MTTQIISLFFMRVLALLLPVGGCCAIMSHIIYRSNHPYKHPKIAKAAWLTLGIVVIGCASVMAFVLLQAINNFTSRSRVNGANSNAKHVCDAFITAVYDLDETGHLPEQCAEIYSGNTKDAAVENTLDWYMNKYGNDVGYWVVVTDGNWNVKYTLCSQKPITPDKIHTYDLNSQNEEMSRLFKSHSDFVGCYNYEEQQKLRRERAKEKQERRKAVNT